MLSKDDVIKTIKSFNNLDDYVKHIILFGSVSRNEHTVNSDLDLCIVLKGSKSRFYISKAFKEFEYNLFDLGFLDYDVIVLTENEFTKNTLFTQEVKKGVDILNA